MPLVSKLSKKKQIQTHVNSLKNDHKENKTACIRAKPWMFRLPIKVYGAVITLKN